MLLGLSLLYVGAVLILNGLWLSGRIEDREIILINLVVAAISFFVAIHTAVFADTITDVRAAAMTLLFAITYLWVAYNRLQDCDGRGLGWFSLFVSVTVVPVALLGFAQADSVMSIWLAFSWAAWAVLWLVYFLVLTLQKPIQKLAAFFTLFCGVFTAWLPGMLLLFEVAN
ncbi:AmiS/UreI family transporter [Litoreibacter halocynthiae]|uniref:AmiS/UreI family transporter n=1 Tax=Litoreibacter halocynthiae TaxID=1242689 RepID=A0A4R7LUN9_9RHOB|nr:AmiS/UreI family transporter [Litoreibacter halocynthiae]TDT77950.1 AmiS/UreI family transporter [Litoreibacter halocynthiae]